MRKKAITLGGAGAVFVLAAFPSLAHSGPTMGVEDLAPELSRAERAGDNPPHVVGSGAAETVVPGSMRLLKGEEEANFYVGRGEGGQICLVVEVLNENDVVASSCTSIVDFNSEGIALQVYAIDEEAGSVFDKTAYYLPADVDISEIVSQVPDAGSEGGTVTSGAESAHFLVVDSAETDDLTSVVVPRGNGGAFRFNPLSGDHE